MKTASIVIIGTFLKYNFPKASVFLGDGGAYLLGSFIAIATIITIKDQKTKILFDLLDELKK